MQVLPVRIIQWLLIPHLCYLQLLLIPWRLIEWQNYSWGFKKNHRVPNGMKIIRVIEHRELNLIPTLISFWVFLVYFSHCMKRLVKISKIMNEKSKCHRHRLLLIGIKLHHSLVYKGILVVPFASKPVYNVWYCFIDAFWLLLKVWEIFCRPALIKVACINKVPEVLPISLLCRILPNLISESATLNKRLKLFRRCHVRSCLRINTQKSIRSF